MYVKFLALYTTENLGIFFENRVLLFEFAFSKNRSEKFKYKFLFLLAVFASGRETKYLCQILCSCSVTPDLYLHDRLTQTPKQVCGRSFPPFFLAPCRTPFKILGHYDIGHAVKSRLYHGTFYIHSSYRIYVLR